MKVEQAAVAFQNAPFSDTLKQMLTREEAKARDLRRRTASVATKAPAPEVKRIEVERLIAMLQDLERMSKEKPQEAGRPSARSWRASWRRPGRRRTGSPTTNST